MLLSILEGLLQQRNTTRMHVNYCFTIMLD
nr:MAG TPA: hypothetical protein [Caudoviricetes sp.]